MDQTFLRHIRECRQNPDLDRGVDLCADRHRQEAHLEASLYTLLQILSVSLFEKMPIEQAFSDPALQSEGFQTDNQLNLFEF
jgi:hypothetical protein